jgi:hypothetical protein
LPETILTGDTDQAGQMLGPRYYLAQQHNPVMTWAANHRPF